MKKVVINLCRSAVPRLRVHVGAASARASPVNVSSRIIGWGPVVRWPGTPAPASSVTKYTISEQASNIHQRVDVRPPENRQRGTRTPRSMCADRPWLIAACNVIIWNQTREADNYSAALQARMRHQDEPRWRDSEMCLVGGSLQARTHMRAEPKHVPTFRADVQQHHAQCHGQGDRPSEKKIDTANDTEIHLTSANVNPAIEYPEDGHGGAGSSTSSAASIPKISGQHHSTRCGHESATVRANCECITPRTT